MRGHLYFRISDHFSVGAALYRSFVLHGRHAPVSFQGKFPKVGSHSPVSLEIALRGEVPLSHRGRRQLHHEHFGTPDGESGPAGSRRAGEGVVIQGQHDVRVYAQLAHGFW